MCTAITYKTKDHYFGRNLDLEYSYTETVTLTPRNYAFNFRKKGEIKHHYAIIGVAYVSENYPLYYDATNEKGLSMAGLNFPENADYTPYREDRDNIAPFELVPWILGQCATVSETEKLLRQVNILDESFSEKLPNTPLHWIISDREKSITVEPLKQGLKIYDNPVGVLTNNPTFDYQMFNLSNYMRLTNSEPENKSSLFKTYSRAMGAVGLPGDLSSMSRFVRATFVKLNSVSGESETESVSQFFHILKSVEMPRGCVKLGDDLYEKTVYSSCCNTDKGIYYYTTYASNSICAVDMHRENLDSDTLVSYPMKKDGEIEYQN